MTVVRNSFYGRVRRNAYNAWFGPDYVDNVEKEDENNPLGGYCVLRLAIRKGETAKPQIEARAVYALLIPEDSWDAILRGLYWDNTKIKYMTRENTPDDTPSKIAAKFVHMPLTLVYQWIHAFENLQASIQTVSHNDDTLPICTLRVETSPVSSVFEKTWQVVEGENSELNRLWQEIWQQMGQTLQTAPIVAEVEESFYSNKSTSELDTYDLEGYQPTLDLS